MTDQPAAMIPREGHRAFLISAGWPGATVSPLAGDASFRRYFRVADRGRTAILMDAPPDREDSGPFVRMADYLLSAGLSAPRLIAGDLGSGFLLIEDFGDRLLAAELARGRAEEEAVYGLAVDLLADLHHLPPPAALMPYDRSELLREAMLFADWYLPAAGLSADPAAYVAAWDAVWGGLVDATLAAPVLVLRDYHAENLMLLDRPGIAGLGLLDFQDALAGHRAYDLVSLLQDARRDVSPRLERQMLSRFIERAGIADPTAFRLHYDLLGLQRNVKILGIFVRLRDRDGRRGYVERLPRVWRHVEKNLMHSALAPLRDWFDAHVPQPLRATWCAG